MLEHKKNTSKITGSSNKSFGYVFTVFFTVVGLFPLIQNNPLRLWSLGAAGITLIITLVYPALLTYPNKLWTLIGLLIHKITNPLIMGFIYFLVITPIALLMRIFTKIPLKLKYENQLKSYWISREDAASQNFKNQF